MSTPSASVGPLKRRANLLIPITILVHFAFAQDNAPSPHQQAAIGRLQSLVIQRCCLQKPAAARIKAEIARMVKEGKSDREILAQYRDLIGPPRSAEEAKWLLVLPAGVALLTMISIGTKLFFRFWSRNRAARE